MPARPWKTLLAVLCSASFLGTLDLAAAAAPTRAEITQWIQQLGDRSFPIRERASQLLWSAGQAAEPALQEALRSSDLEVVRRARAILDQFRYGLYPDTPPAVVKLIEQYRSGDPGQRQSAVQDLLKQGRPGYTVLMKLAALEENAEVRRNLMQQIAAGAVEEAEEQLAAGHVDAAEGFLELSLAGNTELALRNYAAYCLLRGCLDDRLRRFQDRAGDDQAAEVLIYLYRARGDLARARARAEKAGKTVLLQALLLEQGDWKALFQSLAHQPAGAGTDGKAPSPALLATCARLAGDMGECNRQLGKLAGEEGWAAIVPFLFNDRPKEAMAAFTRGKDYAAAFQFLTFQLKYHDAFALADKAREELTANHVLIVTLEIHQARALHQLGETEKARALFSRLADDLKDEPANKSQYLELIEAEYQVGLTKQALAHAAVLLNGKNREQPEVVLARVFPAARSAAVVWWKFWRSKFAGEEVAATLERLHSLFAARLPDKDLLALLKEVEQASQALPVGEQEHWLTALADTCVALGKEELTRDYLEKAAHVYDHNAPAPAAPGTTGQRVRRPALVRLGDFLAEQKQWKEAANSYEQAWDLDRRWALPLYLRGWALTKQGRDKEGKALMERARWLPLGDDAARFELAEALVKHDLMEAARRERTMILRTGPFQSVAVINMQNRIANEALAHQDYDQAADCCERVLLAVLQTGASFLKTSAYVTVPAGAHRYRARGLVAAGKFEEAHQEIQRCLTLLPGDVDLPILLVPALEKAGRKKEADDLFGQVFDVHAGLCADYPHSAWCHNSLAWLAARCRRRLDRGLEHARQAVELAPDNAGFLDTLAEVLFQRGDKAAAVETMKKCIARQPKSSYFRQQLRRFEAGNPLTDVPEE